jgi:ABC-type phosphate/phosphonate transport system substrate-binding protein
MKPVNLTILLFLGALLFHLSGWAETTVKPATEYVRVGFAASLFGEVDLQDAKIATETWSGELGKMMNMKPHTLVFSSLEEVEALIRKRTVDLVVLDSLDYLHLKVQKEMEPILVGTVNGQVGFEYTLVTKSSRGTSHLSQLRGKTINIQGQRGIDTIPRMWLDTLLRKQGLTGTDAFFGRIKAVKKSSQAVLPVFFEQVDAAVTSQEALSTLVELNPQIGKTLKIIATSPRYLQSLVVIRTDLPANTKEKIIDAALKMNNYPRGSQIFSLFRTGGIIRFNPTYLQGVQELVSKSQ